MARTKVIQDSRREKDSPEALRLLAKLISRHHVAQSLKHVNTSDMDDSSQSIPTSRKKRKKNNPNSQP